MRQLSHTPARQVAGDIITLSFTTRGPTALSAASLTSPLGNPRPPASSVHHTTHNSSQEGDAGLRSEAAWTGISPAASSSTWTQPLRDWFPETHLAGRGGGTWEDKNAIIHVNTKCHLRQERQVSEPGFLETEGEYADLALVGSSHSSPNRDHAAPSI